MDNAINFVMLVCAASAALAVGVLLGYGICKGLFTLFNLHARTVAAARKSAQPETQPVSA
jgi:hypothetical protein